MDMDTGRGKRMHMDTGRVLGQERDTRQADRAGSNSAAANFGCSEPVGADQTIVESGWYPPRLHW